MEAWEKWWRRAVDSLDAARLLQRHGHLYSAASRSYYAAYQATTAVLLYQKLTPPELEDREAWSHKVTPLLLRTTHAPFWKQNQRNDLASRLSLLYILRLTADYRMKAEINDAALTRSLKDATIIVRRIGAVLPLSE